MKVPVAYDPVYRNTEKIPWSIGAGITDDVMVLNNINSNLSPRR